MNGLASAERVQRVQRVQRGSYLVSKSEQQGGLHTLATQEQLLITGTTAIAGEIVIAGVNISVDS